MKTISHLNTEYKLIDKSSQLLSALEPFYQASIIALDCETTGLDPYTAQVRLVQLAIADHPVVIVDLKAIAHPNQKPLREILSSNIRKVGHNLKFDLMHLQIAGLPVSGPFGDTYLQWKLLTAGLSENASLEAIATRLLHVKLDKSEQTSNWSTPVLSSTQLKYAATDAAVILPLYDLLKAKIQKASLAKTMSIEEAFLPALAQMSLNGIYLDTQQWQDLRTQLTQRVQELKKKINQSLRLPQKQLSLFPELTETINPNSPGQVLAALQLLGIQVSSASTEAIAPFAETYPVIKTLIEYRSVSTRLNTFIKGLPSHIHPVTKRIHPNWFQLGARSGRLSCREPNLQNIPRDEQFRKGFTAPDGYVIIKADYSQIELRIMAYVSGDKRMCRAYRDREDLHRLTASKLFDHPLKQISKDERQLGKIVNFGLIYGMGAKRFKEMVLTDYNISISLSEAKKFARVFFSSYPGIKEYHDRVRSQWSQGIRSSRTLDGRRRLWPKGKKIRLSEMINHPIQGLNATITKLAIAQIHRTFEQLQTSALLVSTVHDEIVIECPIDEIEPIQSTITDCMVKAGQQFLEPIPVLVETKIF